MLTVPLRILNEMPRTSNAAGGWHNKMSLTPHYTHSSLLKFISGTKKEQLEWHLSSY